MNPIQFRPTTWQPPLIHLLPSRSSHIEIIPTSSSSSSENVQRNRHTVSVKNDIHFLSTPHHHNKEWGVRPSRNDWRHQTYRQVEKHKKTSHERQPLDTQTTNNELFQHLYSDRQCHLQQNLFHSENTYDKHSHYLCPTEQRPMTNEPFSRGMSRIPHNTSKPDVCYPIHQTQQLSFSNQQFLDHKDDNQLIPSHHPESFYMLQHDHYCHQQSTLIQTLPEQIEYQESHTQPVNVEYDLCSKTQLFQHEHELGHFRINKQLQRKTELSTYCMTTNKPRLPPWTKKTHFMNTTQLNVINDHTEINKVEECPLSVSCASSTVSLHVPHNNETQDVITMLLNLGFSTLELEQLEGEATILMKLLLQNESSTVSSLNILDQPSTHTVTHDTPDLLQLLHSSLSDTPMIQTDTFNYTHKDISQSLSSNVLAVPLQPDNQQSCTKINGHDMALTNHLYPPVLSASSALCLSDIHHTKEQFPEEGEIIMEPPITTTQNLSISGLPYDVQDSTIRLNQGNLDTPLQSMSHNLQEVSRSILTVQQQPTDTHITDISNYQCGLSHLSADTAFNNGSTCIKDISSLSSNPTSSSKTNEPNDTNRTLDVIIPDGSTIDTYLDTNIQVFLDNIAMSHVRHTTSFFSSNSYSTIDRVCNFLEQPRVHHITTSKNSTVTMIGDIRPGSVCLEIQSCVVVEKLIFGTSIIQQLSNDQSQGYLIGDSTGCAILCIEHCQSNKTLPITRKPSMFRSQKYHSPQELLCSQIIHLVNVNTQWLGGKLVLVVQSFQDIQIIGSFTSNFSLTPNISSFYSES